MARLQQLITEDQGITIASAVTSLALPPPNYAVVPQEWSQRGGVIPRFELELWATDTVALTGAELFGAAPHAFAVADLTVTGNATTNALASVAHGLLTGDGPLVITGAAPAPLVATVASSLDLAGPTTHVDTIIRAKEPSAGSDGDDITVRITTGAPTAAGVLTEDAAAKTVTLQVKITATATKVSDLEALIATSTLIEVQTAGTAGTSLDGTDAFAYTALVGGVDGDRYYAILVDSDHVKLAASLFDAMSGTAIDLTTAGSGTIKLADVPGDTRRVRWHSFGLLGVQADGAISLDGQTAYLMRARHSTRAIAYAVRATFASGTGAVTAQMFPQVDRE